MIHSILKMIKTAHPAKVLVFGFALLILTGALILMLPFSTASAQGTDFLTALFTSGSAVCVTGLVVVDTASYWSDFGKFIIILLIPIGGLGFMTMATLILLVAGKKISLNSRLLIQSSLSIDTVGGVVRFVKRVLIFALVTELIGAIFLSFVFIPKYGFISGTVYSIFHSVSAFCNAGFDILPGDSLCAFTGNILLNVTISLLIVIGGLGFSVVTEMIYKKKTTKLSLHTKVVLLTTLFLLISGSIAMFALEFNNPATLQNLPLSSKVQAAVFASVTARTAGFNSVSVGAMQEGSKLITLILMFIGGSPGSTAGGVKTTCVAVMLIVVWCVMRNKSETEIFQRRIPSETIRKALSIFFMGLIWSLIITIIISSIEPFPLIDEIFEVISAFGTVGLSTGITASLSSLSKVFIIITMFFGRVGMLTVGIAFVQNSKSDRTGMYKYPDGNIIVS